MPIILPDPHEVANMEWHARDKALLRARRLLRDYGMLAAPADTVRWRKTVEAKRIQHEAWASAVREEARILLADMPADADAASHRDAAGGGDE